MNDTTEKVYRKIYEIFDGLKLNNFKTLGMENMPIWDRPLIGIAAGNDEYYDFLKEHIGNFHWNPLEVFELKYKEKVTPGNLRVISIIFPQTDETKKLQDKAAVFPCDNWVVSRGEWEPLMQEFSGELEKELENMNIRSASIDLIHDFKRQDSENLGIASNWSHRHSAYAAGLGTFSLSDGFISERGIAIRITSIIAEAELDITPREARGPYDWCLYYQNGSCGACIKRCPVNAISKEKGHDKNICYDYEFEAVEKYWPEHIDKKDYIFGCGLCQSKVPCRDKRPV